MSTEHDDTGVWHPRGDVGLHRNAKRLSRGLAGARRSRGAPRMLTLERACVEEALENGLSHDAGANDAKRSSGFQQGRGFCGHRDRNRIRFAGLALPQAWALDLEIVMAISGLAAGRRPTCRKCAVPAR